MCDACIEWKGRVALCVAFGESGARAGACLVGGVVGNIPGDSIRDYPKVK